MRWRAIFFTNNNKKATKDYKEGFSYDLKRGRSPPQLKYLTQFGDDLVGIVKELKCRKVKTNFQKKLRKDMKQVADIKENTNSSRQDIQYKHIAEELLSKPFEKCVVEKGGRFDATMGAYNQQKCVNLLAFISCI